MNAICEAQYSNSTLNVKARNISLLDMEKHLTPDGIAARNKYTNAVQYGKTKTYTEGNSKYPLLYDGQKGAGVNVTEAEASTKITQPNTNAGNDPYEESKAIAETEPINDSTYGTGNPLTVTNTHYGTSFSSSYYGDAASVLTSSSRYWVASRYVYAFPDYAYFGLRTAVTSMGGTYMFSSYYYYSSSDNNYRLRPVVSLSSSILSDAKDASGAWNLK